MRTNPKGLHDAMRRVQAVLQAARLDLDDYIGGDDGRHDALAHVLRYINDAQDTVEWVKETFEHGVRRS